jgi:type IV pilus assembly protein PilO
MTLSDDLSFAKNAGFDDVSSAYPVLFGITLTPVVIGAVVGGLGFLGAVYMALNMVKPEFDKFQQLQTTSSTLQAEVDQKTTQAKQADKVRAELAATKEQQTQVLGLFANEKSLDTLLLDTSRQVESSNEQLTGINAVRAKMRKFEPVGEEPEIINDSSLGEKVNNKLKRQIIRVEIEGKFAQMQAIMRNIERLQPLLLVQNYDSKLAPIEEEKSDDKKTGIRKDIGKLITSFDLVALMPLTEEEAARIAAEEAAKAAPPK